MKLFPKTRNPWPIGLVLFFIVFTGYIVGFVIFASRQKMDLVREDYYDQEIRFQQQIDRVQRSSPVLADAAIDYDRAGDLVTVSLPAVSQVDLSGTVSFYRPSDAGLDTNVKLGLDPAGHQSSAFAPCAQDFGRCGCNGRHQAREYYFEKPIVIGRAASS